MAGMSGSGVLMLLAAAAALCSSSCASLLMGWEAADRRQTVVRAAGVARSWVRAGIQGVGGALGTLLHVRDGPGQPVGLGEVSEMVDIVRLGLSAGLSFDAALGLYCEGRTGRLAERLAQAQLLWQAGAGSREMELMAAARDVGVRSLETFATAVDQALALGAPLADTLAGQSREIRAAHKAEVERQIERAPVKLLIPTGTLILPALLISILGPLLAAGGML